MLPRPKAPTLQNNPTYPPQTVSNGEARLSPGYTVGLLQQEPPREPNKTEQPEAAGTIEACYTVRVYRVVRCGVLNTPFPAAKETEVLYMRAFLKEVPVPTAGLALGMVAFGSLVGDFLPWLEAICLPLGIILILLVSAKALVCRKDMAADLKQPVQAAVFGTFFMTYMQIAAYIAPYSIPVARGLWILAVIGHFILMAWFTKERILEFKLGDVFATWFVCYVGIIVGSLTSPAVDLVILGRILFWFGFVAYIFLLVLVTARHAKISLAAGAAPTFCIYAAPMSLSIAGYIAVYDAPNLVFVLVLEILAQLLFIVVLTQLPKFLRTGFFPSYAAMTFPFIITATALSNTIDLLRAANVSVPLVADVVFYVEMVFAGAMTLFVLGCFVRYFYQKATQIYSA